MNKAAAAAFFTIEVTDPQGHVEWNWWHSSDHIPENVALGGVVLGRRWAAPRRLMDARLEVHPSLARTQYLVHYLFKEPVAQSVADFSALGARVRAMGRMYDKTDIPLAGHYNLLQGHVAPRIKIVPEALPYRPHKGVFVHMCDFEEDTDRHDVLQWYERTHIPDMLKVKGVAGVYWFQGRPRIPRYNDVGDPEKRWVFLYYLDQDPLTMVADLKDKLPLWKAAGRMPDLRPRRRTILAAPYATITDPSTFDWNKA